MILLDDEHYVVHIDVGGVSITGKHFLGRIPSETYTLDSDFFTKIADAFQELRFKMRVFDNWQALQTANSTLTSYAGWIKYAEVLRVKDGADGQCAIIFTCSSSCKQQHIVKTQGELQEYIQHIHENMRTK